MSLHCSDICHLHSAPKHPYSPYARPYSKPLSWSKANNWNDSDITRETNKGHSTKTKDLDVRGCTCVPQRQVASSYAKDSESCSKLSYSKSWPTTKSTHKLIIYAYHESQDQALPTMSEQAITNHLNTQATTIHKRKSNANQVSDHQSSKWPKCPLVNEPCAPIYPTQVQFWYSYDTKDSGFDPQWSHQFVDPSPVHQPTWLAI